MKDASITFKDKKGDLIEYRVFNVPVADRHFVCVFYFCGYDKHQTFQFPIDSAGEQKFDVNLITITTGPDKTVVVEYPSYANLRVIEFRSK